jgi:hypothetical protein
MITILSKVYHVAAQQDHEVVEQVEAVGCGRVDGGADGDAAINQILHRGHHLRTKEFSLSWSLSSKTKPAQPTSDRV